MERAVNARCINSATSQAIPAVRPGELILHWAAFHRCKQFGMCQDFLHERLINTENIK
jgi:hypothetical protein